MKNSKRSGRGNKRPKFRGPQGLKNKTIRASVDKNRKGFAFLVLDTKGQEDLFVPKEQAARLFHGDRVEIELDPRGRIQDLVVLEHRYFELVGTFLPRGSGSGHVIYERKNTREEIFIPNVSLPVKSGEWVKVKLRFGASSHINPVGVTGEIIEVFGQGLPAAADVSMIAAEYGCIEAHSSEAVSEAKEKVLNESHYRGREDLRELGFVTIDGETARDFDDAIYVVRKGSGFVLWVAIADVSSYVTEGSALDQEAKARGTSVYFPERAFHMLPGALSENLCSLRPNEPRLALVAKMEFDRLGQNTHTQLMEAVIESKRRATYEQVQAEWEENKKNSDWELSAAFGLYGSLKKSRKNRGSIDFDLPEAEVKVDAQGEVLSIENRQRVDAHRLIEEFMIAANEAVTQWMMSRTLPFIYRVHEEPTQEALDRFRTLAATAGFNLDIDRAKGPKKEGPQSTIPPKVLADIVRKLEGHASQALLNMALLRSMKQAVYSATHGIHYGLASEGYTHFTSPIRRYPDLVVHRLIKRALGGSAKHGAIGMSPKEIKRPRARKSRGQREEVFDSGRKKLEGQLAEICAHCSYRERLAADAEREIIKLKQVRLMSRHLGDEFDGKIVGMIATGVFIQLTSPFVEGMVAVESLPGGEYRFNEEKMIFQLGGSGQKGLIRIGDPVRVQVVRTDLERRQIEFAWVETNSSGESISVAPKTGDHQTKKALSSCGSRDGSAPLRRRAAVDSAELGVVIKGPKKNGRADAKKSKGKRR